MVVIMLTDKYEILKDKLVKHEGISRYAYQDTVGMTTIGVGRNIDAKGGRGLSTDEIFYLLQNDISLVENQLSKYGWFTYLNSVRQEAIIELTFNIGLPRLLEFHNMISALVAKNFSQAARALLDSKWADEVGKNRSQDVAQRLNLGRYL